MEEHAAAVATPRAGAEESVFLPFLAMFASIYLVGYLIVFRRAGARGPAPRPPAASPRSSTAPPRRCSPSAPCSPANTAAERLVLDFSTAYFAVDLAHYLLFLPGEALFVAHHLATLYALATCRHAAGAGAAALLPLVVLAEATSAAQNVWTLAGMRRRDSPLAARVHAALSPPFYAAYTAARAVLGLAWFVRVVGFFHASSRGGGRVPTWASWTVVIGAGIVVSILWLEYSRVRKESKMLKSSKQQ